MSQLAVPVGVVAIILMMVVPVPTALLDMRDQYGVIKYQAPFALTILAFHVIVMWLLIRMF